MSEKCALRRLTTDGSQSYTIRLIFHVLNMYNMVSYLYAY